MAVFHDSDGNPLAAKGALRVSNENFKIRDSFESLNTDLWELTTDSLGDMVTTGGNTQGSGYIKISKSLDEDDTDTILLSKFITPK
jgi:hypothetical protein